MAISRTLTPPPPVAARAADPHPDTRIELGGSVVAERGSHSHIGVEGRTARPGGSMAGRSNGSSAGHHESFNTIDSYARGNLLCDIAKRFAPQICVKLVSSVATPAASAMLGAGAVLTAHGLGGSATGPVLVAVGAAGTLAGGVGITVSTSKATGKIIELGADLLGCTPPDGCIAAASTCVGTLAAINAAVTASSGAMLGAGSAMLANDVGSQAAGIALTALGAIGVTTSTVARAG
jgi:hypothetical protein